MTVSSVAVGGGTLMTYIFNKVVGADNCTGATLAPGATCTVGVRFTNVGSARGTTRTGTITFTDNGAGSPQGGALNGFATP
jgi:predicted outer membrane repeat protein